MALIRRMRIVEQESIPMETALKIAFCTDDMKLVNQHFGSAKTFALYSVDVERSELLEAAEFGKLDQDGNEDKFAGSEFGQPKAGPARGELQGGNEHKLATKIALLEGCAAVYCEAIGASAIRQLQAAGIQPVKVNRGSQITDLLEDFQAELRSGP